MKYIEDNDELSDDFLDDSEDIAEELSISGKDRDDRIVSSYLDDQTAEDKILELERRKAAYSILKKDDKIFNNSYNMGTVSDEMDESFVRTEIKIDPGSAEYDQYNKDQQSDFVDNIITNSDISKFIDNSELILEILKEPEDGSKKKFTKIEINEIFDELRKYLIDSHNFNAFVNSIHILDTISSLTNLEYKKLFDMLTYENKEILLIELDKKYSFLNKSPKNQMYE